MTPSRRTFMMTVAAGGATIALGAQAQTMVDEKSAQATALGYAADTTQVDAKKYPKHAASQLCNNCALFQGKASDPAGACALFPGKQVAGKGWCSAWSKKA
ncbi:high-potential iron-sulfur protein [Hydrogenophaga sp. PAMC20947]|uniref:high-potential iron-sulfur protein n=1 Tax=Hydrogenophaga sp. PAMC20947 TaxID=2565558 RepID=UPI00109D87B3|nr:high-potential iron-sulfur protein [Hydrogenophaga sp. PAMC20947]QCB44634.1 twin-arginine translocation signal domain-containing protein [Hydrogenophaga sp. PAMC20947]